MIKNIFLNNKLLVAVAHNDDIEFIAGGILNRHATAINQGQIKLKCITFAVRDQNTQEKFEETLEHQKKSFEILGIKKPDIINHQFRARLLPSHEDDIRLALKRVKQEFEPNIVITHYKHDPNQDHSSLTEQVLRVFRDKTIIGGEISNSGIDMRPNLFIGVEKNNLEAKAKAVNQYKAESHKYYFNPELLLALARVRGAQSGSHEFAEAFEIYTMHVNGQEQSI